VAETPARARGARRQHGLSMKFLAFLRGVPPPSPAGKQKSARRPRRRAQHPDFGGGRESPARPTGEIGRGTSRRARYAQRGGGRSPLAVCAGRRNRGNGRRAAPADTALAYARDQSRPRIAPERLGKREAKIAPIEPDVLEHAVVELGEEFEVAPMTEDFRHAHDAAREGRAEGTDRPYARQRALLGDFLAWRHGNLHFESGAMWCSTSRRATRKAHAVSERHHHAE